MPFFTAPGISDRNRCRAPTPIWGRMAMKSTMIPMPPSQWVKLRQKSRLFGDPSISVRIDEPVVVKPDMLSKKASTGSGMKPER